MICKITRRELKAEAERLGAEKFGNNIYQYEAKRGDYCHDNGYYSDGIAYSAGTYGNIGRIDKIVDKDNKTIKYIYWA